MTDLKTILKVCGVPTSFGDELTRDQIIYRIIDNALRERLLQEPSLKLSKCIEICKAAEAASSHLRDITNGNQDAAAISHVRKRGTGQRLRKAPKASDGPNHKPSNPPSFAPANHDHPHPE